MRVHGSPPRLLGLCRFRNGLREREPAQIVRRSLSKADLSPHSAGRSALALPTKA